MAETRTVDGRRFLVFLVVVSAATIAFSLYFQRSLRPPTAPSAATGRQAPPIKVEGWLNGPGPSAEELRGKVIVLDAWAFWCVPCRALAPELVALHKTYSARGVVFLGITSEGSDALAQSQRFLSDTGISWPNGYGALETLEQLRAEFIPQRWVIDGRNNIVWNEESREPIEAAIDRALQAAQ